MTADRLGEQRASDKRGQQREVDKSDGAEDKRLTDKRLTREAGLPRKSSDSESKTLVFENFELVSKLLPRKV